MQQPNIAKENGRMGWVWGKKAEKGGFWG